MQRQRFAESSKPHQKVRAAGLNPNYSHALEYDRVVEPGRRSRSISRARTSRGTALRIGSSPVRGGVGLMWVFVANPALGTQRHLPDIPELKGPLAADQVGYDAHYGAPIEGFSPAVYLFQQLPIRKWEEHLQTAVRRRSIFGITPAPDPTRPAPAPAAAGPWFSQLCIGARTPTTTSAASP